MANSFIVGQEVGHYGKSSITSYTVFIESPYSKRSGITFFDYFYKYKTTFNSYQNISLGRIQTIKYDLLIRLWWKFIAIPYLYFDIKRILFADSYYKDNTGDSYHYKFHYLLNHTPMVWNQIRVTSLYASTLKAVYYRKRQSNIFKIIKHDAFGMDNSIGKILRVY